MRNILRTVFPALLLMTFLSGSALAQTKIATVDLKKLFDNYYKTKLAQASIQERAAQLDKDDKGMKDDLKKGSDEYQQLLQQANDQALSAEERDRRKQSADDKLKQLQTDKATIDQYERQAQTTLGEQRQRMRENILTEIKAAVNTKAKAGGYSLVFDTAAETVNGTMTIVYTSGDNDLTDDILSQLNAGAPIDVTKPAVTTAPPVTSGSSNP
ncbi:MAG TPA: OmpH family outer membrane protein [Verrucomicrobiae bacterium]|jgi:outer membrane protein|nr:OmpH family outer membrane protein [Verrucomicrobiae bacterium]